MSFTVSDSADVTIGSAVTANLGTNTWDYTNTYGFYRDYYYPTFHVQYEKSKTDVAFKIVKKLKDKGMLTKNLTVGKFIDLVHEIAEEM